MTAKLYLISQTVNNGCETYYRAVVVANSEEEARMIHPEERLFWVENRWIDPNEFFQYEDLSWTRPENVVCRLLSDHVADEFKNKRVVCRSFNAG